MSSVLPTALNPLALVTLGLLAEGPRHPYEMYQILMRRREDINVKIRPGSLYHAVAKLDDLDYVQAIGTDRDGNRPERTTYQITAAGELALAASLLHRLGTPVNEYPIFPVALAEAHNLTAGEVAHQLRARISALQRDVDHMQAALDNIIGQGKPRRWMLDLEYLIVTKRAEIGWLDGIVEQIDDGTLPWENPPERQPAATPPPPPTARRSPAAGSSRPAAEATASARPSTGGRTRARSKANPRTSTSKDST